ncbi:MAG: alanine racemase, partial [Oscillospiraceae bacterium]|nr:alanine racemase [Oscillospiraceae bacterium]
HFSAQSDAFTQTQVDRFGLVLEQIKAHGFSVPSTHLQGSYGLLRRPDLSFDYARVGLALYGAEEGAEGLDLRPVLSVKARISTVKEVRAGETVGYGRAFAAPHEMKIAVLSIGYADGLPRALSCGLGHVLIGGTPAPIVGLVCMDQVTVDVTQIAEVKQGDIAVVIGRGDGLEVSALDLAERAGTIPNEILSRLGGRLMEA